MSSTHQNNMTQSGVAAVIHQAAGEWRVAVGMRNGGRGVVKVLGTKRFSKGENAALRGYLDEHRVADVIAVLPASRIICRMCVLPNADPEQLEDALSLQAEAMLLGNTPEHRVGMAVLSHSLGETTRTGLIVSWPESAEMDVPDTGRPVHYAPDLAGIAALMNGLRPSEPILWLDRAQGTVATAITHANGLVLRGTREDGDDDAIWARRVSQAMAESALSVGHTGPFVQDLVDRYEPMLRSMGEQSAMLLAPDEVLEDASNRLEGFVPSSASWSDFGIAAGVMLAHFGPLTALTRLVDEPPEIKPSRIRTMAENLSRPGMAVRVVITALVLLALAPLLMSGLRLAVLNLRFGDIDAKKQAIDEAQQQVRLYESLEGEAWSMAKVLSDMVSNAPLGIDLQVVRAGTSEGTVVVTGLAKLDPEDPGELVVKMQKDLAETGIFRVDNFAWGETNNFGNQREFDLSLSVVQPHRRARYDVEHDFEQWTLQQRIAGLEPGQTFEEYWREQGLLSGSGAAATPTTPAASMSGGSPAAANPGSSGGAQASATGGSSAQTRTPRAPRFGNTGNLPAGTGQMSNPEDRSATGAATRDIPEVLTEAQIAAMSRPDVQERLERVAEAIKFARSTDDVELQENMQSQFRLLMERLRETRQENR